MIDGFIFAIINFQFNTKDIGLIIYSVKVI